MKTAKVLLISAMVFILVLSSGCLPKKWSYDFTSAAATLDDWYLYQIGTHRLDDAGLCLYKATITTPVYFTGDTSVKIVFELDVSEFSPGWIEFGFSDGIFWSGDNETWSTWSQIGNDLEESWMLGDFGGGFQVHYVHDEPIPNLNHDGSNVVEFKRIGNKVTLLVNGDKIGEIDLIHFDINTDGFFPTVSGNEAIGTVTIKSIEVRYNGDVSEMWPV